MTATESSAKNNTQRRLELALIAGVRIAREDPVKLGAWCDPKFRPEPYQRTIGARLGALPRRALIVLPPSHGKSRLATEFCAMLIGADPARNIMLASHSDDDATSVVRTVRDRVAHNPRFGLVYPTCRLHVARQGAEHFRTGSGGGIKGVSIGEPALSSTDWLVFDDPLRDWNDGQSATRRDRLWDWYGSTLIPKLRSDAGIVVIGSRTHDCDLFGRLIAQGGWELLEWPAETQDGPLWPSRYPDDYLRKIEASIGPAAWRAMYLVKPDKDTSGSGRSVVRRESFKEFLEADAKVPGDPSNRETRGTFQPYTFAGREALVEVVDAIDNVLTNNIKDAQIALAGGAQFGKTIIEHGLMAYATGQLFRNVLMFLPDERLVKDMVQLKFRPNVVDQLPWFADMIRLGVATNESGKTVDRIGAFLVSDGVRKASGLFGGLGKVPTSVSGDIALEDEIDDIDERNERFVSGRLAASDLRAIIRVGTQRVHGRGMNKAWRNGSQGVVELVCEACGHAQNPEEEFPGIVCSAGHRLTHAGEFRNGDECLEDATEFYLGCVRCGAVLDRSKPRWTHRRPEEMRNRHWSFRISQLSIGAIGLDKIVNDWKQAVQDENKMLMFRCDVLGLPRSSAQKLEPEIVDRARRIEIFEQGEAPNPLYSRFAGLDMGGRCWFVVRERRSPIEKRVIWAESIPLHQVGERVPKLVARLGVACTFIDQMPETKESRNLALRLNGLDLRSSAYRIPHSGECSCKITPTLGYRRTASGDEEWTGLKAAVVRFDQKRLGKGIVHTIDEFLGPNGQAVYVPLIQCNRFETIDSVVREFLTPAEGELESHHATGLRELPAIRLPQRSGETWGKFDDHHILGSEREKLESGDLGDYIDGVENHFLFANAYARLAEVIGGSAVTRTFQASRIGRPGRQGGGL